MTQVSFLVQALADLWAARTWYEGQRGGLGDEFAAAVAGAVDSVGSHPFAYPVVYRETRRVLIRRFPNGLYYRHLGEVVIVIAVLHVALDPVQRFRRLGS